MVGQALYQSQFSVSPDCVGLILLGINSLLLANLTKNPEEARKPVSLHSGARAQELPSLGVAKDILLCNLNCVWLLQP